MMMTKKHFEEAARIVRLNTPYEEQQVAAAAFVKLFREFGSRFDRDRFIRACGIRDAIDHVVLQ